MDVTLERIFSLIPKKPNGKFVHGAKKIFCESIEAPPNIMSEWERGISKSYRNYLYAISAKYNVSVEWLKGETDDPTPLTGEGQKNSPAIAGEEDEATRELRNIWNTADDDERAALLEMARLIKKRRAK